MMINYWTGIILLILIGIVIIFLGAWITRKMGKGGSIGGILGFFCGVAFVFIMVFIAGRLYVVTGDSEFSDFLVYGSNNYKLKGGNEIQIQIENGHCLVINDWDQPVIVEIMKYGGYGFGGDTEWVKPNESKIFEERKIFYFFEDGPPEEISVRGGEDNDEYIRLWLRKKRD